MMKIDTNSKNVNEFLDQITKNLGQELPGGMILHIGEIEDQGLHAFIQLTDNVTGNNIKSGIPEALLWKKSLDKFQGKQGLFSDQNILNEIIKVRSTKNQRLRQQGRRALIAIGVKIDAKPYQLGRFQDKEIVQALNEKLTEYVYQSQNKLPPEKASSRYFDKLNSTLKQPEHYDDYDPFLYANLLLKLLGFQNKRRRKILEVAVKNISDNLSPFGDGPITIDKFRDILKNR